MFNNLKLHNKTNLKRLEISIKKILFLLLIGSILGSIATYYIDIYNYDKVLNFDGQNYLDIINILEIVIKNLKYFIIIWFLGFVDLGKIFIFLLSFVKGFNFGFTTAIIIYQLNFQGLKYAIFNYLPQAFLYIPFFIFVSFKALEYIEEKRNKNTNYYKVLIFIFVFSLMLSFIDILLLNLK